MAYINKDYSSFILHVYCRSAEALAPAATLFHVSLHSGAQAKGAFPMWNMLIWGAEEKSQRASK